MFSNDGDLAQKYPNSPAASGQATSSLITMGKDRPGHDWRYAIDARRIESELGYSPKRDFVTGLQATIAWMFQNESWWRSVIDGSYRDWIKTQYED